MQNTEVISAFLDNEPFDARELASALSEPYGRDTLIQLIGLRHVVQPPADVMAAVMPPPRHPFAVWVRAAVVLLAIGAGYAIGTSRHGGPIQTPSVPDPSTPPAPTIVVPRAPDAQWDPLRKGE